MLAEIRGLNEECGVFGIWGHQDASQITYYGLHSLQHRGQEGTGMVVTDGKKLKGMKGEGLVTEIFTADAMKELEGKAAIGHVRYATAGGEDMKMSSLCYSTHKAEVLRFAITETW